MSEAVLPGTQGQWLTLGNSCSRSGHLGTSFKSSFSLHSREENQTNVTDFNSVSFQQKLCALAVLH